MQDLLGKCYDLAGFPVLDFQDFPHISEFVEITVGAMPRMPMKTMSVS